MRYNISRRNKSRIKTNNSKLALKVDFSSTMFCFTVRRNCISFGELNFQVTRRRSDNHKRV